MNNGLSLWRNDWSNLGDMQRNFDRFFADFIPTTRRLHGAQGKEFALNPLCDIQEYEDKYTVSMDVPGISKQDIKIEMLQNQIVISGERKYEERKEGKSRFYQERQFGSFQRVFTLPTDVDVENIHAAFENGVLTMSIPKAAKAKARKIEITEKSTNH